MIELKGKPASSGISIGIVHLLDEDQIQIEDTPIPDNKIEEDICGRLKQGKNTIRLSSTRDVTVDRLRITLRKLKE